MDTLKAAIEYHLSTISNKDAEIQRKQEEIVQCIESLRSSEEKIVSMTEALGSPMKHLEVFLASKDEKIGALEASLHSATAAATNAISEPVADVIADASELVVEEKTAEEPTVDVSSPKIIEVTAVSSCWQQQVSDPAADDARDDAGGATEEESPDSFIGVVASCE